MATLNGDDASRDSTPASLPQLGKRKRSQSPEKKPSLDPGSTQQALRAALKELIRSPTILSFLQRPVPATQTDRPELKRPRLSADRENDTIEKRIELGHYETLDQAHEDINTVRDALIAESTSGQLNGESQSKLNSAPTVATVASTIIDLLNKLKSAHQQIETPNTLKPGQPTGQVITLRSQTAQGVRQLYSGLQKIPPADGDAAPAIDGRRLPNGFDLTDAATIDTNALAPAKEKRLFGDVFRPKSNLKPLEPPRSRPVNRSNNLHFGADPINERSTPVNRLDYKHQVLPTPRWMDYSRGQSLPEQDPSRKYREKNAPGVDFKAALMASQTAANAAEDPAALFRQAFSSFAPSYDTTEGLISPQDRNRQWWHQFGRRRMKKIFKTEYPELDAAELLDAQQQQQSEDDFSDVVNYEASAKDSPSPAADETETVDEILSEISQLLETLHSHQTIRNLDTRASSDASKPSNTEFDTYELLRSQLAILITSLPPFAVAKLDGDKLSDLDISPNLLVDAADYPGTGQADSFTLSRHRAAQPALNATARPTQPPYQPRQSYQTPAAINKYATGLQSYSQNLAAQAYSQRQGTNYQTPQTAQRPYQQAPYSAQPTVQQFQRPQANGYGNYTPISTGNQNSFARNATQPGYQPRTQSPYAYGNANQNVPQATPQKSMAEEQAEYYAQLVAQHRVPRQPNYGTYGKSQHPGNQQQENAGMLNGTSGVGS